MLLLFFEILLLNYMSDIYLSERQRQLLLLYNMLKYEDTGNVVMGSPE